MRRSQDEAAVAVAVASRRRRSKNIEAKVLKLNINTGAPASWDQGPMLQNFLWSKFMKVSYKLDRLPLSGLSSLWGRPGAYPREEHLKKASYVLPSKH